jgi:hypothetical protein
MSFATEKVIGTDLTPQQWKAQRDLLTQNWLNAKATLDAAKETEAQLRRELVAFVADPNKISGTENIELGNGYKLKAVKKINYTFVSNKEGIDVADAVDDVLTEIENLGADGKFIAERLVKWKPELSLSEYKLLDAKCKALIDSVIQTKEGLPTLEFIEPKAKQ